ncbi:MAG: type I DNA topoisomerase [Bacteroidales bacterium]|jgi:DNA topoisomerase-1|nr:type I DNA topoisomerase [Bacteroidales bacterium]
MAKNLVIVESPAKAKTIEKFLGKDFIVKSSFGHIRDLEKNKISIEIDNDFEPIYSISQDKTKVVSELLKEADKAETIWLASDEDREGEAIAWHLKEALRLPDEKVKRIVFNEITKSAILSAVENPRQIDINLVNAQQARRILDRIVGYEISPVLWKKVKPALSAGRVQSVAVRLIVEREEEIKSFKSTTYYKVIASFKGERDSKLLNANLNKKFETKEEVLEFLKDSIGAEFIVSSIEKKPAKQSPQPPFTTSTLQQEASRKLGYAVSRTMLLAQKLYEAGHITYMRTDSVNLSSLAISMAKDEIETAFGKEYHKARNFATKTKGAQEAHEAIRPTYFNNKNIDLDSSCQKLYDLIWKRTIASQMADAKFERTNIGIDISSRKEKYNAQGEIIIFDGFLKVYSVSKDDEENTDDNITLLPNLKNNDNLEMLLTKATQAFTNPPPRYNEAMLVKKLEDLGIGRPSTYAPTISTIQKREYVVSENRIAKKRDVEILTLSKNEIKEVKASENFGAEKSKLIPTDIGIIVNGFLVQNFKDIIDYNFTAEIEKKFDDIARGAMDWRKMLDKFYTPFHKTVTESSENSEKASGERLLGKDPKTNENVYARIGRFGPMVQIGEVSKDKETKPKFASMRKDQRIDDITLEQALVLFNMPRNLGEYKGEVVTVNVGRFGPYIKHGSKNISIPKTEDAYTIELEKCIDLIDNAPSKEKKVLKSFGEIEVLEGMYGPYIKYNGNNIKIPKQTNIEELSQEECQKIIDASPKKKTTAKKTTTTKKTSAAKKTTTSKKTTKSKKTE